MNAGQSIFKTLARGKAVFLVLSATVLAPVPEAHADLRLCNQTASQITAAVGYKASRGWRTEGWWNFRPDEDGDPCKVLVPGPLTARFYYIYALDVTVGGEWSGEAVLCTQQKEFIIDGVENCLPRGYEQTGFFEVDTGDQESWTVNLTNEAREGS